MLMFEDLKLSEFTWRREPILYLALAVAIGNVILGVADGAIEWSVALESLVVLIVGFFGRGQVTPLKK